MNRLLRSGGMVKADGFGFSPPLRNRLLPEVVLIAGLASASLLAASLVLTLPLFIIVAASSALLVAVALCEMT